VCARGSNRAAVAAPEEVCSIGVRPIRQPAAQLSPLVGGSACHRRCKCPVDSCAGCHRSSWLLSNLGCLKRQTPSVDTCRCVPNPEHPRIQLPIGISVACAFYAGVFLVARINGLESFASNNRDSDLGGCAACAQRCLSTVASRTRCFERRSGVHSYSHTVYHGCSRTTCSIRYRPPSTRRVFPRSGRSVGSLDRIGSSVSICSARRLTTRSGGRLRSVAVSSRELRQAPLSSGVSGPGVTTG
jgi:hypothetical protein